MLALGVDRQGYLAFEYLFPWDGGRAGWVSGMAQATGMQALAGAAARLGDARLMQAANRMLGGFLMPPPWGVRVDTAPGRAQFLLYSHKPALLVGNGFAQALLGLDRYRELSGDPRAAQLVGEGLAEARAAFPGYRHRGVVAVLAHADRRRHRVRPALPPALRRLPGNDVHALRATRCSAR